MVTRVYENVPHYRRKMDAVGLKPSDIRSINDLCKLPFTTKQDLRDTYPYGMFAVPMEEVNRIWNEITLPEPNQIESAKPERAADKN